MADSNSDEIFSVLSKLTIIIPLVVIVTAIVLKYNGKTVDNSGLKQNVNKTPSATSVPGKTASLRIDIIGPWQCDFEISGSSTSAFIKNKQLYAQTKEKNVTENFIFNNDCLYRWQSQKYTGDKYCGLSPMISLVELMSGISGGLDLKSLVGNLSQIGIDKNITDKIKNIDLDKSCQKKEPPVNIFTVPTNVLFLNAAITPTGKN